MKILKKILCIAIPFTIIVCAAVGIVASGVVSKYSFFVDTNEKGNTLSNPVSNINIWSIEGNPFKDAVVPEKNNIFEFVDYVQFMQCSGGTAARDLFVNPQDTSVHDDYDFTVLIDNCRGVMNLGAKPMLKLGSVPMKYTADATTESGFGMNPYPPDDFNVYYNYVSALANALVDEFGKEEVLTWRFGVMTEYENADWFKTQDEDPEKSAEAYCKLYDYTVQALIDNIGENVFVGAHSMTVTEGLWDEAIFIKHCGEGTNYKTGKKGTRLCYLATSFYDYCPGEYTEGKTLPESVEYLRSTAESVGLDNLIYGVDEGRLLVGNNSGANNNELLTRICGYTYQASYDARLYKQMFENDIDYFSSWGYLSGGLLSGNPTVSYHVAENAAKFEDAKLITTDKTSSGLLAGAEVDAVSAYNETTQTVHIMAYNFKNKMNYKHDAQLSFTVNTQEPDGKNVKITTYIIDDDCNYFDEWIEDRKTYGIGDECFNWSPDDPQIDAYTTLADENARNIYFSELFDKYTECSRLEAQTYDATVTDGKIELNVSLAPYAVVFFEISLSK